MKRVLYIILLAVEFLLGSLFLSSISIYTGWNFLFLFFTLWAALTALVLVKLKRAESAGRRRKLRIFLALVMLIPLAAGVAALAAFVIALSRVM
jgi:hypothetical protein